VNVASVQSYHGDRRDTARDYRTNYAFRGYTRNWYFNSDRKLPVHSEGGIMVRDDGQAMQAYGLEIEVRCYGIQNQTVLAECCEKIIFPVFKFGAEMFKMQNDCTIGGDTGVEIITQPCTKSRIRNDYAAYKTMFNTYFPAFNMVADSMETTCGMHVNVSNACFGKTEEQQVDSIRKLFYLLNKHYDFFVRALYRDPGKTDWCGRMDYDDARTFDIYNASGSHGNCFNMSHFREGRVEIRLVGGQKDYYCFRNTMETVFFLVDRLKALKWSDLDSLETVFKGCNQYVYKRLSTECTAFLTYDQLENIRASVKEENLDLDR